MRSVAVMPLVAYREATHLACGCPGLTLHQSLIANNARFQDLFDGLGRFLDTKH
jgi:hypothetical protein